MAQPGSFTPKFGRKDRRFDPRIPHYSALRMGVKAPLPPIPSSHNWATGMPADTGYLLNDQLGDCTIAGILHARQVWTFNATGTMAVVSDAEALWAYESWAGYVNGDPNTDNGADEQTILTDWFKQGIRLNGGSSIPRDHISAFIEVDPRNLSDVRRVIYEAGVCYIGFNVPSSLENSTPPQVWDVVQGQTNIVGGHAVVLTGYDGTTFDLLSWGSKYKMTIRFFETFTDETYCLINKDFVAATGKIPLGLSLQMLDNQMDALRHGVVVGHI
jgi:hypothetical protein